MAEETITPRDEIVYKAKLAEQAERYDEMAEFMKEVARLTKGMGELTVEERNLLSVAYKNAVGSRRASWRIISSVEQKEKQQGNPRAAIAAKYREKVETELLDICMNILDLLSDSLIPDANIAESTVFYYKMQGDYFRYISEFRPGQDSEWADKAHHAYEKAAEKAVEELAPTHPIRLGLFLNYSVFHYEIKSAPEKACKMAQDTFDCAITELDHVSEECYKDSTLIMQLLRDNLTLWSSEAVQETGKEEQQ